MTPDPRSGSPAPTHTRARGTAAERAAFRWLAREGYRLLATNYNTPVGEIDAIALDGPPEGSLESPFEDTTLCFLEIKARANSTSGPAIAAVHPRKQQKIARAASLYLAASGWEGPCRFDVLGMDREGQDWTYTLIRDAFSL